jgi:predicted DNA-binding protein
MPLGVALYLASFSCHGTHRNLDVPLPGPLHDRLHAAATRAKRPATSLAREAIEAWVDERQRQAVHEAITEYATEMAGTAADLDEHLERAGIEHRRRRAAQAVRRGDIFCADLAPRSGSEQTGRRPVVVVSHDGFNRVEARRSEMVVPLSTFRSTAPSGPTAIVLPRASGRGTATRE